LKFDEDANGLTAYLLRGWRSMNGEGAVNILICISKVSDQDIDFEPALEDSLSHHCG
ncbi:hypothetical protein J6590_090544, partial [Homalodisca vitripennis]